MKLNNKGFTLAELLAVIVVLAIITLIATNSVNGTLLKIRKNALATEGNSAVHGAEEAYQLSILNGEITNNGACYSLKYLYEHNFYTRGSGNGEGGDKYTGSVLVTPNSTGGFTYKFWISNGSYKLENVPFGVKGDSATDGESASSTCGDISKSDSKTKTFN